MRFEQVRKQFGSDLLTAAVRKVGLIITPIVERIEKCIKDVFTRIYEYTVVIRRSHTSLVSSLNLLISEKSQQEGIDNDLSNFSGEDLAEEVTDALDATSSSDKNAAVFEILKTKRSSQNDGKIVRKRPLPRHLISVKSLCDLLKLMTSRAATLTGLSGFRLQQDKKAILVLVAS